MKSEFQVKAKDKDQHSSSNHILYRLEGQGAGEYFQIDENTGEILVVKPLDRDEPSGAPQWNFVVQAIDDGGKGLVGYADVQVNLTDINDNAPFFQGGPFEGSIEENKDPGGKSLPASDHTEAREFMYFAVCV